MRLKHAAIIDTVACVLAIVPSIGLAIGSAISGASPGAGSVGAFVAYTGLFLPGVLAISIVGVWGSYVARWERLTVAWIVLPWLYFLAWFAGVVLQLLLPR